MPGGLVLIRGTLASPTGSSFGIGTESGSQIASQSRIPKQNASVVNGRRNYNPPTVNNRIPSSITLKKGNGMR